ncbi:hypothetical protein J6590_104874 [Homalodisca vitripennis]|nr:hypothetical protein J6590_104873 [Homalodisca vitripennis]KAG8323897.1 hypothetical protein J6590_104874 [Homalodisca vitripennis]
MDWNEVIGGVYEVQKEMTELEPGAVCRITCFGSNCRLSVGHRKQRTKIRLLAALGSISRPLSTNFRHLNSSK